MDEAQLVARLDQDVLEVLGHYGDDALVDAACKMLGRAERPLVLTGSGILWSAAESALQQFVDLSGIPFYTTPQGRGVVPDDHPLTNSRPGVPQDHILVVIQLAGGNDGLNTIIPLDHDDYRRARPRMSITKVAQ